jgi:protein-S-isoprenylcysteine O-methyltransferase Ste14
MTATAAPDNPGVIARPPLLTLAAFLIGAGLEWLRPTCIPGGALRSVLGLLLAGGGVALIAAAMRQFRAAGTNIETYKPSEAIVSTGLYARSRNPIYVGMAVILIGLGLAIDSLWVIAMVVPLLAVLRWGVIAREERYLARKFGEPYRAYTARVRRWL